MTKYRKNQNGKYVKSNYVKLAYWVSLLTFGTILTIVMNIFAAAIYKDLEILRILMMLQLLGLFIIIFAKIIEFCIKFSRTKSIKLILQEKQAKREIEKSLLQTMTLNKAKDEYESIYLPAVRVRASGSRDLQIFDVEVEKMAGMYEIEKLEQDINSSFKNSLAKFGVVSSRISDDKLKFIFTLEDVTTKKTLVPHCLADLKNDDYVLQLQKGLTIRLDTRPHIAIYGKTGSGKSTQLRSLILQLFQQEADLRFIDGKDEFSAFDGFYDKQKIASEVDDVNVILDDILRIVSERQKIVTSEVKKQRHLGLRASDIGLKPVVLIADEVGSIVAQMDSKTQKEFNKKLTAIIQRGRSVGVNVIVATQDPSVDTLPQKIRQQFSTRILLGSAKQEIQRMALDDVATIGNVEEFTGYYVCDGWTIQPQKFYVTDLKTYNLDELDSCEDAYNILGMFKEAGKLSGLCRES